LIKFWLSILIIAPLLLSCNRFRSKEDEPILARVQDEYLYQSEVTKSIPKGISPRDSITMAQSLINKWIEKTMLLKKAEKNLTDEELNFEKQMEKYRRSLVVYKYETKLVRREIDTIVGAEKIRTYYNKNKKNFRLKDDLIKVHYILLPLDYDKTAEVRRIFFNEDNTVSIEAYCKENDLSYFLEDSWMYLSEVKQYLPLKAKKAEDFEYMEKELKDSDYQYFIKILDVKTTNDVKPLEMVRNDIRTIIVNQRKTQFVQKMHNDVVKEGFDKNEIEIY